MFHGNTVFGNRVTSVGDMVANMVKVSFKKPDMELVESLKRDSEGSTRCLQNSTKKSRPWSI